MSSEPTAPAASALRGLTPFEIIVHGLADGLAGYVLLRCVWQLILREQAEVAGDLENAGVALLVLALSLAVFLRRSRPESRGLRLLERGLSGLFVAGGVIGAIVTLLFMASGARYKGPSPDAGGMAVMAGLFLFYPSAGLALLPLAMNASRLPSRFRWRLGCGALLLAALPVVVLLVARLLP